MLNKASVTRFVICCTVAGVFSVVEAQAPQGVATLGSIEGETMVSSGSRYVDGTEGMRLKEGQRVMAIDQSAVVQFDDGCRYVLPQGKLLLIELESPCARGIASTTSTTSTALTTGLGWVPPAAMGLVGIMGTAFPGDDNGGGRGRRAAISP